MALNPWNGTPFRSQRAQWLHAWCHLVSEPSSWWQNYTLDTRVPHIQGTLSEQPYLPKYADQKFNMRFLWIKMLPYSSKLSVLIKQLKNYIKYQKVKTGDSIKKSRIKTHLWQKGLVPLHSYEELHDIHKHLCPRKWWKALKILCTIFATFSVSVIT